VRAFLALDLPYEIKNFITIELFSLKVNFDYDDIKWVETHNYHLTFKFFENIEREVAIDNFEKFKQRIEGIKPQKVLLSKSLGFFYNSNTIRVIFIDVEPKSFFVNIHKNIVEIFGKTKEDNRFSPHITLGRVKRTLSIEKEKYLKSFTLGDISFVAKEICLFKSTLTNYGPIYEKIVSVELR